MKIKKMRKTNRRGGFQIRIRVGGDDCPKVGEPSRPSPTLYPIKRKKSRVSVREILYGFNGLLGSFGILGFNGVLGLLGILGLG